MQRNNPTFEINGRSYDALSGAALGVAPGHRPAVSTASLDGMVGHKKSAPSLPSNPRRTPSPAKHVAAHRPQPTKTLMRRAVATHTASKAAVQAVPVGKHQAAHARQLHSTSAHIVKKLSSDVIDPRKSSLAQGTHKNPAINKFPSLGLTTARPALNPIPVPVANKAANHMAVPVPQPRANTMRQHHNGFAAPTRRPATSASPQSLRRPAAQAYAPAVPMPVPPAPNRQAAASNDHNLFSQALAQATSHEEPAPRIKTRKSRRKAARAWGMAGTFAVLMALFGFIAFQNRDDIRLQIASAKAGFSAAAPLYKPDGYKLSDMKYATGSVASIYQQGNQNFIITQKKSNWDSQTLLENFVANANEDYEGFQANGRTVYVYGNGNATWVNGGIWYQIKATSNLGNEQLVKIAASM